MSYQKGLEAINLKMPDTVPRTEYSAEFHWELVKAVTGNAAGDNDSLLIRENAKSAFVKAWDYGMYWNILTHNHIFGDKYTKMGHASYNESGSDYSAETGKLFDDPEDVYDYDMFEAYGKKDINLLTAEYNLDYQNQLRLWPDAVPMTGIYVSCMSGLIELLGWNILLSAAAIDRDSFGAFVGRYCDWIFQYFEALANSEAKVVMIHDDIVWSNGAFLHPDFYRRYIFPNYKKLFAPLNDAKKTILFTSDGNFTEFIDDIAGCNVNGFVLEPSTDMAYIAEKYGKTHAFVGNADTNVLLRGRKEDIEMEVRRCMDIGKKCPGFIMAVGNHIPPNTPVDNALYYDDIFRKYARR
ncbi:MAG: uroporphyrinogen decarboxylase family protein [Lachnospiraceae bacterium]|nr:uroporphyrinogen decarboxylase family protein [Lachnospiraceae bacterium]